MRIKLNRMIMTMLFVFSVTISVSMVNANATDAAETTDSCEAKIVDYDEGFLQLYFG